MQANILVKNSGADGSYINHDYHASNLFSIQSYDDETQAFIDRDGYASVIWECQPIFGGDEKTQERLTKIANTDFPDGSFLQIMMFRSPNIRRQLAHMNMLRLGHNVHPVVGGLINARAQMFEDGTVTPQVKGLHFKNFELRVIITFKIPLEELTPKGIGREDKFRIKTYAQRLESSLKSEAFLPKKLDGEGYLHVMSSLINWGPKASWRTGEVEYDEHRLLSEQILDYDKDIHVTDQHVKIGDYYIKSYSAKKFPSSQYFGDALEYLGDLHGSNSGIHYHYAVCVNVFYPNRQSTKDNTERRRLWAVNQAKPAAVKLAPILADTKAGFDVMHESMKEGNRPVKMTFSVFCFAPDEEQIIDAGEQVGSFFDANRFTMMPDRFAMLPVFLNHLPGGACKQAVKDLRRYKTVTGEHVAVLAPFFGEWKGTGTPHMLLTSRNGQVMSFSPRDSDTNMNMLIAATSGAGKSFFTNDLALSFMSCGYKVWIIDVGRSYEKVCRSLDQNFISFDAASHICLNPFPLVVSLDGTEATRSRMLTEREKRALEEGGKDDFGEEDALVGMLCSMASQNEKLSSLQISAVKRALQEMWEEHDRKTTVKHIRKRLLEHEDQRVRDVGEQLYAFAEGSYSRYFEGENNLNIDALMTVLELEELKGRKHLQSVVLFQLIYQIQQEVYLGDRSPKFVIIDEAWDMLQNGGPEVQLFLEHAYRRFRKYGASVLMCTQSLNDLEGSSCGEAILSNSATKCLFRHAPDEVNKLRDRGTFTLPNGGYEMLKSVHTNKGFYSEVFIRSERGTGVGRLFVTPFQKLLYSTDAEDVKAIKQLTDSGMTTPEAINRILRERGEA